MVGTGTWEVGSQNRWEMGGWPSKQVGDERMALKTGGRWEDGLQNRWEMGGWPSKQVGDGRMAPKTGGR